jgi:hypothetical protein
VKRVKALYTPAAAKIKNRSLLIFLFSAWPEHFILFTLFTPPAAAEPEANNLSSDVFQIDRPKIAPTRGLFLRLPIRRGTVSSNTVLSGGNSIGTEGSLCCRPDCESTATVGVSTRTGDRCPLQDRSGATLRGAWRGDYGAAEDAVTHDQTDITSLEEPSCRQS